MQVLQRTLFGSAAALLLVGSLAAQGPTLTLTRTVDVPSDTVHARFEVSGATSNSNVFLYYGDPLFPGLSGRWGTLFIDPATLGLVTVIPIDTLGNGSTSLSFPMSVPDFNVVLQGLVLGGGGPPTATDARSEVSTTSVTTTSTTSSTTQAHEPAIAEHARDRSVHLFGQGVRVDPSGVGHAVPCAFR